MRRHSGGARCRLPRRSSSAWCSRRLFPRFQTARRARDRGGAGARVALRDHAAGDGAARELRAASISIISPDGKRIAYLAVKPENGNVELYVRELDALEARPIPGTEAPNIGPCNPFFSPDGKSIGYSAPDRGLISVAIDGRPPIKIADRPTPGFTGGWWAGDNTVIYSSASASAARLRRVAARRRP